MCLEILLILLTAGFTLLSLFWFGTTLYHDVFKIKEINKDIIVKLLDITLLTLIIIDVLQIVVARYTSSYEYLRVAVEVGILSMLRELISIEIKKPDPWKVIAFAVTIFILFVVWVGLSRSKVIEAVEKRLGKVS
jgi:uncharacterized membrane protein (DUF373 family)